MLHIAMINILPFQNCVSGKQKRIYDIMGIRQIFMLKYQNRNFKKEDSIKWHYSTLSDMEKQITMICL